MRYGHLTVITGPMFSGKSTELLKNILMRQTWAKQIKSEKKIRVLKPAFDDRYSKSEIVSHEGLRVDAESICTQLEYDSESFVFIDEVQFFVQPYFQGCIINMIQSYLDNGTTVMVTGLDLDWAGGSFDITGKLLAMADKVIKLTANCTVCGQPASKSFKKTLNGGSVELGSSDKYEARCNEHWVRQ